MTPRDSVETDTDANNKWVLGEEAMMAMYIQMRLVGATLAILLLMACADAHSQQLRYRGYNSEARRPNPPTEVHVSGENPSSYQPILDALSSADVTARRNAASRLLDERDQHYFHIHDLVPHLESSDERVVEFTSSVIVDWVVARPYESGNLRSYVEQFRQLYRNTKNPYIKANCVGILAMAVADFSQIESVVLDAIVNGDWAMLQNAAIAVQVFAPPSIDIYSALTKRLDSQSPVLDVANAMSTVAANLRGSNAVNLADRLMEGAARMRELGSLERQASFVHEVAEQVAAIPVKGDRFQVQPAFQDEFSMEASLAEIFEAPGLTINGSRSSNATVASSRVSVRFLGERQELRDGLNTVTSARATAHVWLEDKVLRRFEQPYKKSYAIVAAIDNYGSQSSAAPGLAEYRALGSMVTNAKALAALLQHKGFPRENIFILENGAASSKNIRALLEEFWRGGRYETADRLLFYFAGHGDHIASLDGDADAEGIGFLITADYDPKRPTLSSLLMRDLTSRHFENIVSNHVLMLLDSCSSGLALPKFQSTEADRDVLARFRRYTLIAAEHKRRARNILVAGTGRQEALWENGGVFTRSLIAGLDGGADFNRDRIVEFDELALYVKDSVRSKAAATGVQQEPAAFKATAYGKGSVLLLDQ